MRKLSILGLLVLLCLMGTAQNPAWTLPDKSIKFLPGNSFAIPPLPQPGTYCNNGTNPNNPNYVYDGYDGQLADFSSNMMLNREGEVEFFIVDGIVYDGEGNYINSLMGSNGLCTGASETVIIPDPADCDRYYIVAASVTQSVYTKLPDVFLLDMSLPNEMTCTDCDHFGALVLQSCPGSSIQNYYLPVSCLAPGFVPADPSQGKVSNCHIAASDLQQGSFRWVFISNSGGIFRFKIDGNGFNYDNYFLPFAVSTAFNNYRVRSEMELVELPGGGFRLAAPYQPYQVQQGGNYVWEFLYVVDLDANGNALFATEKRFPMFRYDFGGANLSASLKGVEFSEDGSRIYVTHTTSPLNPNQMEYYDFGSLPVQLNQLPIPSSIDAQNSMLELTANDKLILANQNGLYQLPNSSTASTTAPNMTQMWPLNYAPTYEGNGSGHFFKMYMLPDQIDGMDYEAHFTANLACCINNSVFEAETYSASSGTWMPNTSFNGNQNPLQPNVSPDIHIKEELRIPAGVNLTIANMNLHFAPGARLVIENGTNGQQGGVLTLDNSLLTVDDRCTDEAMWLGVEVWGNTNEGQGSLGNSTQGRLFMRAGSRIEHAQIGTLVGKRNHTEINQDFCPPIINVQPFSFDYARTGGIVRADKGSFFGNQRGVYFLPYLAGNGANNLSRFSQTDFSWDGPLRSGVNPQEHAYLRSVKGIYFYGCTFRNATPSAFQYYQLGTGIFSYRSQFYVRPHCSILTLPCESCPGEVRSSFENLRFGLRTYNPGNMTFSSLRSDFLNCQYGAYVQYTDGELLRWNKFDVRQASYQTAGIVLRSSTDFTVEENNINGIGSPAGNNSYGIVVNNSGTDQNDIYLNSFSDLHIGGQSESINAVEITASNQPGTTGFNMSGLNWTCNDFDSEIERADLTVVNGRIDFFQGHAIGHNSYAEAVEGSARNHFSLHGEPLSDEHDVLVSGSASQELQYVGLNTPNYWADSYTASEVLPLFSLYMGVPVALTSDMCPSKCGKTKFENQAARQQLQSDIADLEGQLARRPSLELSENLIHMKEELELLENRMTSDVLLSYESLSDLQTELDQLDASDIYNALALVYAEDLSVGSDEPRVDGPEEFLPLTSEEKNAVQAQQEVSSAIKLTVYPNPSQGIMELLLAGTDEREAEVKVIDLTGRTVHRQLIHGNTSETLQLSHLPTGLYNLLVLQGGAQVGSRKIEILH